MTSSTCLRRSLDDFDRDLDTTSTLTETESMSRIKTSYHQAPTQPFDEEDKQRDEWGVIKMTNGGLSFLGLSR